MWKQKLCQVLFLHWPIGSALVRPYIPSPLALDLFDGQAWVSLVVFRMEVRLAYLPRLPLRFAQVNFRTYVRYGSTPGIWFLNVHAHHYLAATIARSCTPIPYSAAPIHYQLFDRRGYVHARCQRSCRLELDITFTWSPSSSNFNQLRDWLLERYHLFALDRSGVSLVGRFQHAPWLTFPVRVETGRFRASPFLEMSFVIPPTLAHFSPGIAGQFGQFETLLSHSAY